MEPDGKVYIKYNMPSPINKGWILVNLFILRATFILFYK